MKSLRRLLSLGLILSSFFAWGLPSYVAKWNKTPGFVHLPKEETVYLLRTRWIYWVEKNAADGTTVNKKYLGQLTPLAYQKTLQKINAVNPASPWTDENPGDPFCVDLPGYFVSIVRGDHEVRTYESSRCHTFTLQDHSADPINKVMLGLGALVD
jgi:hypothetical protein